MSLDDKKGRGRIQDSQIADQRFVYYADSQLFLLSTRQGASWYTYKGQLWPLFTGTQTGEQTMFLTRVDAIRGVAPTLAEVQMVYPLVTTLGEGDNFVVQLSDGVSEYWDIILGSMSLRFTDIPSAAPPIEFRVDGCATLQYRINAGPWQTIAVMRVRLDSGQVQISLDPSATPVYCNAISTITCP